MHKYSACASELLRYPRILSYRCKVPRRILTVWGIWNMGFGAWGFIRVWSRLPGFEP